MTDGYRPAALPPRYLFIDAPPPPGSLNPNAAKGRHYGTLSGERGDLREAWMLAALEGLAKAPPGPRPYFRAAIVLYTIVVTDYGRRDWDNVAAAIKNGQDGLADAGVLPDDDFDHLTRATVARRVEPGGRPRIEIELMEDISGCRDLDQRAKEAPAPRPPAPARTFAIPAGARFRRAGGRNVAGNPRGRY